MTWDTKRNITAESYLQEGFDGIMVDLREKTAFSFGTIGDAVSIPLNDIKKLYDLPKNRKICVFCQSGEMSQEIAELLSDAEYDAYHLVGGYRAYIRQSLKSKESHNDNA